MVYSQILLIIACYVKQKLYGKNMQILHIQLSKTPI